MLDENERAREPACVDIPCMKRCAHLADESESVDDDERMVVLSLEGKVVIDLSVVRV